MNLSYQEFLVRFPYDPNKPLRIGGQGAIYYTIDQQTKKKVALKRAQVTNDQFGDKYSVFKEFTLGKNLKHPNLATYYDAFRFHDTGMGVFDFGVMEYIEGGTNLDDFIMTFPTEPQIKSLLIGILEGLKFLHHNNIIHRDLKPNNILVDTAGKNPIAKIIDFGVSKELSSADTVATGIVGTFEYMAPEQINPLPGQKMQYNLDLWSLGVIIYRIFTGEMPFGSSENNNSREEIQNRVLDARIPEEIKIIPQPYQNIIKHCLVRDVQKRVSSADELLNMINQPFVPSSEVVISKSPKSEASFDHKHYNEAEGTPKKRHQYKPFILLAGTAVLAVAVFFGLRFWQQKQIENNLAEANQLYLESNYAKAFQILNEHKESKWFSPHASFILGELLFHGYENITKDISLSKKYFQTAVDGKVAEGYLHIADLHEDGEILTKDTLKARELRNKAKIELEAENADRATALAALADLYGMETDEASQKKARDYYFKAAQKGFTYAMCQVAFYFQNALGGEPETAEAVEWLQKAVKSGDPAGMVDLGNTYLENLNRKDSIEAVNLFRNAAQKQYPEGMVRLGDCYLFGIGNLSIDKTKAVENYKNASNKNHPHAWHSLGYVYQGGHGVNKDEKEAFSWYKKAADKNYSPSMYEIAKFYENGNGGLKKDNSQAFYWCKRAADGKYVPAQYLLGTYYRFGTGTAKNLESAFQWYQIAANNGHLSAQNGLGFLYDQGIGTKENDVEAVKWYKKSAYSGYSTAQFNLGFMYEYGQGIRMNYDSAYHWYMQAYKNGMEEAEIAAIRLRIQLE